MKIYVLSSGEAANGEFRIDGAFTDWNVAVKAASELPGGVDVTELRSNKVEVDGKTVWFTYDSYSGVKITQLDLS